MICFECGTVLTDEERHFYDGRCESCEGDWHDRVKAWRVGGADHKLDEMFGEPAPTLN